MWDKIKAVGSWIATQWDRFERWVASKVPGVKVKLVAAAGGVSSGALMLQEWLRGLPMDKIITAKSILATNIVLFTLIWWFRRLTNKV